MTNAVRERLPARSYALTPSVYALAQASPETVALSWLVVCTLTPST
jgi:hypothetical protein